MIDHMTVTVRDIEKSREFYAKVLAPLGYKRLLDYGDFTGFGDKKPEFWIKPGNPPSQPMHIAFAAKSRVHVDKFHEAALAAGAADFGAPGPRPQYHKHYYGAFVTDPDGHPIEAVCHLSPSEDPNFSTATTKPQRASKKNK